MKRVLFRLVLIIYSIFFVACGENRTQGSTKINNGENTTTKIKKSKISGVVIDGYLEKAKVCLDKNTNGKCDKDEPSTVTSSDGKYSLDINETDKNKYPIIVEAIAGITIDADNPSTTIKSGFTLTSTIDKPEVISPITTLIKKQIDKNPKLSSTEASKIVSKKLNITDDKTLFEDYVVKSNEYFHTVAKVIVKLIVQIEEKIKKNLGIKEITDDQRKGLSSVINDIVMANIKNLAEKIQKNGLTSNELNTDIVKIKNDIAVVSSGSTSKLNPSTITYTKANGIRSDVNTTDKTPPTIILAGDKNISLDFNATYIELGAIASDNIDGNITSRIVKIGSVNTTKVGIYRIIYSVKDSASNIATTQRIVTVKDSNITKKDNIAPMITLIGANNISLNLNSTYIELGANAIDNVNGNITNDINISGRVDTSKVNTYTIIYSVMDSSGNKATQINRTVIVLDTIAPLITLNGSSTINLGLGDIYNELGATGSDDVDGNITSNIVISGILNNSKVGTYTMTYNLSDKAGNNAITLNRNIVVSDNIVPTITLNGASNINIELGTPYNDLGAIATDNIDGNITANIIKIENVDTSTVGTYTITYNISDKAGNKATQITRTVTVNTLDTIFPTITLSGDNIVQHPINSTYIDNGATANDNIDGNITNAIIKSGTVDTSLNGSYTIRYTIKDSSNNETNATRLVKVRDWRVSKTGQTKLYKLYDDGYHKKGLSTNYSRDSVKKIVTDNYTGLIWQDDSNVSSIKKQWISTANYNIGDYNNTSGDTATTYCKNLTIGGYNDWRLPTYKELLEILDYSKSTMTNVAFNNTNSSSYNYYWTTNNFKNYNRYAYNILLTVGRAYKSLKNSSCYIRCVRGE